MARKIALTPASIDAWQKGLLADLLTPGLAIEVLASGKKRWRYRRQVAGQPIVATLRGQLFPAQTIAAAREWARGLNEMVEAGIDPHGASPPAVRRRGIVKPDDLFRRDEISMTFAGAGATAISRRRMKRCKC